MSSSKKKVELLRWLDFNCFLGGSEQDSLFCDFGGSLKFGREDPNKEKYKREIWMGIVYQRSTK